MNKKVIPIIVFLICVYALFLRLGNISNFPFWADEIYGLNQMKGSFINLVMSAPNNEIGSYLLGDHYLIYPFFKVFGYNRVGLAFPHILATILGFFILYLICRLYFKTIWGYLVAFIIVCFNQTLIYHSIEIRPYAVIPTLALGVFYFTHILLKEGAPIAAYKKWLIGIFFIITILFHVYGILIVSLPILFLLFSNAKMNNFIIIARKLFCFLFIIFCITLPVWCISVFGKHWIHPELPVFEYIPDPLLNVVGFLKGIFGNLIGSKGLYFLLAGVLFPFIFSFPERTKQIKFLLIMVILPIGLILSQDIREKYWFLQRQFIWVMPYFAFFLGWVWDSMAQLFIKNLPTRRG
ncbi:MAG: glycosyltransferase family 39 protein [Candidatus Omnitrophica bacterium]|nr:glycosyltransferase family 39 protein [Candidatus Omnitrophota bacterium]